MDLWQLASGLIAGLGMGLIGGALARMPASRVRPAVCAVVAAGVLWAVGDVVADAATSLPAKQLAIAVLYTGTIGVAAFWWLVVLRWAEESQAGLPLRSQLWHRAPLYWAGLMWLVMITNPWHGAFLTPVVGGRNLYGPLWYAMALPSYALILAALAAELEVARRVARPGVRGQAAYLIAASLVTLLGNWLYVTGLAPLNLTVVVLAVSGSLLVVGMAQEGLFGVLPSALPAIAADHPDGLVVVGADGHVRYANPRAHELLAPLELRSDRPLLAVLRDPQLRSERELPADDEAWWESVRAPEGALVRIGSAAPRWLYLSASRVNARRERGQCLRIADVTAPKQAELHARQTRRLESVAALARSVSRDFQGAFALVHANAEMLAEGAENDADSASRNGRRLTRILEAARFGSDLAQQLQLYAGSVDASRVSLELSEVVEETCGLAGPELPANVELVRASAAETLLPVEADPIQIRHAIFELLTNAIEATAAEGGRIEVTTGARSFDPAGSEELVWGSDESPGEFAWVRVRDEGGGMEAETEERAFEPFFGTRGKERGHGLPTVLGVARAHDALLGLENEPGRGCAVTLYFPLAAS